MVSPPEVFVVGSARAGTSTLRTYFAEHPSTFVPDLLEPRHHGADLRVGVQGPGDRETVGRMIGSAAKYEALYRECAAHQRGVEVTPAYLSSRCAPESIGRARPDAKIIAVLRHPVERAFSSFRLERLDGTEPEPDFGRALALEGCRQAAGWGYVWRYRHRGLYSQHLLRWFRVFPREQVLVLLYDDWHCDGGRYLLERVFTFLGLSSPVVESQTRVENSAAARTFASRGRLMPTLDPTVASLLLASFAAEIADLEALLDRDLTAWRNWQHGSADPVGPPE